MTGRRHDLEEDNYDFKQKNQEWERRNSKISIRYRTHGKEISAPQLNVIIKEDW